VTPSKYPLKAAIILVIALCLAGSAAIAQPMDQGPTGRSPASANVYVPPAELWGQQQDARTPDAIDAAEGRLPGAQPGPPQGTANPNAFLHVSSDDGSLPWLAIGLGLGGVVLLAGCSVGLRRTQRRRTAA
jgi:hypothetical protein